MNIEGEIPGLCALTKFKKYSIVACMPLDDSIHATNTPLQINLSIQKFNNYIPWPQSSRTINVNKRIPLY
jgi:hypothetical protein